MERVFPIGEYKQKKFHCRFRGNVSFLPTTPLPKKGENTKLQPQKTALVLMLSLAEKHLHQMMEKLFRRKNILPFHNISLERE